MPDRCKPLFDYLPETLTRTELEVLRLLDVGLSNQEIADKLKIAVGTVKWHLHHVFDKLQARNRTEAVARARDHGILRSSQTSTKSNPSSPNF